MTSLPPWASNSSNKPSQKFKGEYLWWTTHRHLKHIKWATTTHCYFAKGHKPNIFTNIIYFIFKLKMAQKQISIVCLSKDLLKTPNSRRRTACLYITKLMVQTHYFLLINAIHKSHKLRKRTVWKISLIGYS